MHPKRAIPVLTLLTLVVGGCAPTVRMEEPRPVTSTSWSGQSESSAFATARFSSLLNAPELEKLTRQALENNSDIRIASARVAQSHAMLRVARQATLPEIALAAGANRSFENNANNPLEFKQAFARLDVDLDLDLFGRLSAAKQTALSRTRAAELERAAVALAVEVDVASAYVQRTALARRIAILDTNIERAVELDRVIRLRSAEGDATRVDQGLQSIRLLNLRERGSRLRQALDETRTALAILTGSEAPQFAVAADSVDALAIPQIGLPPPLDLLAARPDVRASEALIEAAKGDVAQARAAFFPQIGISLQGLLETATSTPLGKSLNIGSSLLAPIFSRGRLQSALQFASALQLEAVERYRQTILAALAEVENARSAGQQSAERAGLLDAIVEEARLTARLANVRYIEGEEDLLSVLDAQTSLSDAEDAQVVGWQERIFAQIALYRSMGGYSASSVEAPGY